MQQQAEPGGPLDQGADRRAAVLAHDQVPFPMPGHRPVGGLGGPVADHHHVLELPGAGMPGPPWPAHRPARPQAGGQLPAQSAPALHIQRLVDRLVGHPHLALVGEPRGQGVADLPRRPLLAFSQSSTCARSTGSPASFATFGRRARPSAATWAPSARYRPRLVRFRATSRHTVLAGRPSPAAIARSDQPAARPTAISSRSATPRYRPPTRCAPLPATPPACRNHTSAVCRGTPHRGPACRHPTPARTSSQNSTRTTRGTPREPAFSTTTTPSTIKPLHPVGADNSAMVADLASCA